MDGIILEHGTTGTFGRIWNNWNVGRFVQLEHLEHLKQLEHLEQWSKIGTTSMRCSIILVPRAAILLASATDQELWQGPKTGSPRITEFWLSAQPQKFETITVTIVTKMGSYCALSWPSPISYPSQRSNAKSYVTSGLSEP